MNIEEFRRSLSLNAPPEQAGPLLQALWHEACGDWGRAHEITQEIYSRPAARVHAYLHRREGDLANAGYWYRRAGVKPDAVSLDSEWESLVLDLMDSS